MTKMQQGPLPATEELIKVLQSPDAPPRIILDLTNSDGPLTGVLEASLDKNGNLVLKDVG